MRLQYISLALMSVLSASAHASPTYECTKEQARQEAITFLKMKFPVLPFNGEWETEISPLYVGTELFEDTISLGQGDKPAYRVSFFRSSKFPDHSVRNAAGYCLVQKVESTSADACATAVTCPSDDTLSLVN